MSEAVEKPIEARVAAKWWADALRHGAKQQLVSPIQRQMQPGSCQDTDIMELMMVMAGNTKRLTEEQISEFENALIEIIVKRFIETDGWEKAKENPCWGSAVRTLAVDYGACDELRAAYQFAGGPLKCVGVFPAKTVMWISPGTVRVRYGYGAPEEELMKNEPHN